MTTAKLIRQCREALEDIVFECDGKADVEDRPDYGVRPNLAMRVEASATTALRAIAEWEQAFGKQDQLDQQDATAMGESMAPYKRIADLGFCAAAWQALAKERGKVLDQLAKRVSLYPDWMWESMLEREAFGCKVSHYIVNGIEHPTMIPARLFIEAEKALSTPPADALARRDQRMKVLGSAEWLEAAAKRSRWFEATREQLEQEAAALRQKAGE